MGATASYTRDGVDYYDIHVTISVPDDSVGYDYWYKFGDEDKIYPGGIFCPGTYTYNYGSNHSFSCGISSADRRGTTISLIGPWGTRNVFVYRGGNVGSDQPPACSTNETVNVEWDVSKYSLCSCPYYSGISVIEDSCNYSPMKITVTGGDLGDDTQYNYPFVGAYEEIIGAVTGVGGTVAITPSPSNFCSDEHGYASGTDVSLIATPDNGYCFDHWSIYTTIPGETIWDTEWHYLNGSTSPSIILTARDFEVYQDSSGRSHPWVRRTYADAIFTKKLQVTVSCIPLSAGRAEFSDGSTVKNVCKGTTVSVRAYPDDCHWLDYWEIKNETVRKASPSVTIESNTNFCAYFTTKKFKTEGDSPVFKRNTGELMFGCEGKIIFGKAIEDTSKKPILQ